MPKDAAVLYAPDTRTALADVAAAFYGHPADKLRLIGITGTKGKTSTALLIYSIFSEAGIPVGYIGTVGVMFCGRRTSTLRTTPESADIQLYLYKMVKAGVKIVIIEVSSQAIFMERIHGLKFETCIFTNLSPDHIGRYEHRILSTTAIQKRAFSLTSDANSLYIMLMTRTVATCLPEQQHFHAEFQLATMLKLKERIYAYGVKEARLALILHAFSETASTHSACGLPGFSRL